MSKLFCMTHLVKHILNNCKICKKVEEIVIKPAHETRGLHARASDFCQSTTNFKRQALDISDLKEAKDKWGIILRLPQNIYNSTFTNTRYRHENTVSCINT